MHYSMNHVFFIRLIMDTFLRKKWKVAWVITLPFISLFFIFALFVLLSHFFFIFSCLQFFFLFLSSSDLLVLFELILLLPFWIYNLSNKTSCEMNSQDTRPHKLPPRLFYASFISAGFFCIKNIIVFWIPLLSLLRKNHP